MYIRSIIFIVVPVGLYYILKWFYGKRYGTASDIPNKIFFLFSVILAFGLLCGTPYFGTKTPGSFFERDEYEGMFYVNLFPNAQKVKSYSVPAKIIATIEGCTNYDEYYDGYREDSCREYRIKYAVMPNGGKITFFESNETLQVGHTVTMFDYQERYWGVELTKLKAK